MRLVKSIVGDNNNLIGFVVEGTAKEFNEKGTVGVIYKSILLQELVRAKFSNDQVRVSGSKLEYLDGFKLSDLPMMKHTNGQLVDIGNTAIYNGKINHDNRVWCEVLIDGEVKRYTYEDTIRLAKWFKLVDRKGNDVDLSKEKDTSGGGAEIQEVKKEEAKREVVKDIKDLITLMEIVKYTSGIVVMNKEDKYEAEGNYNNAQVGERFIKDNIGGVSTPFIGYTEESLNATLPFKVIGHVEIPFKGSSINVPTYIHRAKKLISNGKLYLDQLIIGITIDGVNKLVDVFGRELLNNVYKNDSAIEKIESVANLQRDEEYQITTGKLEYFYIDLTKIPLITKYNAQRSLVNNKDIMEMVRMMNDYKLQMKLLRGQEKDLLALAQECGLRLEDSYLLGPYVGYDNKYIVEVLKAGIDLRTGEFRQVGLEYKRESTGGDTSLGVSYAIRGDNVNEVSYEDIKLGVRHRLISKDLEDLAELIEKSADLNEKYEIIQGAKKQVNKQMYALKSKLWLHKLAIYTFGDEIDEMGKANWEFEKRTKKYTFFRCKEEGCGELQMKIRNV